jgi:hypothetical protein
MGGAGILVSGVGGQGGFEQGGKHGAKERGEDPGGIQLRIGFGAIKAALNAPVPRRG